MSSSHSVRCHSGEGGIQPYTFGHPFLRDRSAWDSQDDLSDLEGHRLAQTVAYGDLGRGDPAVIGPDYERQAEPVIELQLEKAGIRLACLLNADLR